MTRFWLVSDWFPTWRFLTILTSVWHLYDTLVTSFWHDYDTFLTCLGLVSNSFHWFFDSLADWHVYDTFKTRFWHVSDIFLTRSWHNLLHQIFDSHSYWHDYDTFLTRFWLMFHQLSIAMILFSHFLIIARRMQMKREDGGGQFPQNREKVEKVLRALQVLLKGVAMTTPTHSAYLAYCNIASFIELISFPPRDGPPPHRCQTYENWLIIFIEFN